VTYVNRDAYSAGAFIAVATKKIYMAPQSVIGAAAPILMTPGGGGVDDMPDTVEAKMVSAVAARVRASAEKNGHNKEVVEAMINKTKKLVIDGEVLNEEGNILTLTDREASREFGDPPRPLLSLGTVESIDALLTELGLAGAKRIQVEPTGVERLASWLNAIGPILLIIGIVGIYLEFKTPGFGVPGIVGIIAFGLYFLGGAIAGLSGWEWVAVFVLGLVLVGLELFLFPGTIVIGFAGVLLMLVALVMAMVDVYPGTPQLPSFGQLRFPLQQILIAFLGSAVAIWILSRILPSTPIYRHLVSSSASGMATLLEQSELQKTRLGQVGTALSSLRPGGKARFGEDVVDVVTQGELLPKGSRVRIIAYSGADAVVEKTDES
jgi:membrane-bound serine protease (ClpP class)